VDYLKFPIALKYYFGSPGRTPFIKLGGYLSSAIKREVRVLREAEADNKIVSTWETGVSRVRTPRGLFIGAGYDYRISDKVRTFLELRLDRGVGFFGTGIQPNSKLVNYTAIVGLTF
jgi:hypothetical protein